MDKFWTKELPKESGYFWYRDNAVPRYEEIIFWDVEFQWVRFCGNEIPDTKGSDDHPIVGEFWNQQIFFNS